MSRREMMERRKKENAQDMHEKFRRGGDRGGYGGGAASNRATESTESALVIASDIGGTNARMQLWEAAAEPQLRFEKRYDPKDFGSLEELLRRFCADAGAARVECACVGIPGPVEEERFMTGPVLPEQNATSWKSDARAVEQALGDLVGRVVLLNDFVAVGLGLTALGPDDYVTLHDAPKKPRQPIACVGAGTGLGEVLLTWDSAGYYSAWPSEGGMADFNAHSEEEWRLRQWLYKNHDVDEYPGEGGVVTVEAVVSGPGLANVYKWLLSEQGEGTAPAVDVSLPSDELPGQIAAAAEAGDGLCARAVDVMLTAYAREVRRKACDAMPYGGMFVAGGVAPKLLPRIREIFPREFLNDPVNRCMLEAFPLYLVTNEQLGLLGVRVRALRGAGGK